MCGKLFCHNGKSDPNYGRMVRIGNCKAAFFSDSASDYGQVDTGTKCGDGMVMHEFPLLLHDSIFAFMMVTCLKIVLFFKRCVTRMSV